VAGEEFFAVWVVHECSVFSVQDFFQHESRQKKSASEEVQMAVSGFEAIGT
jgi:hypothetical protein